MQRRADEIAHERATLIQAVARGRMARNRVDKIRANAHMPPRGAYGVGGAYYGRRRPLLRQGSSPLKPRSPLAARP